TDPPWPVHSQRTKRAQREPAVPLAPASSGPQTFGAGMLHARKVRSQPSASVPLPRSWTFGEGVLARRTSRAKPVLVILLTAAAIAAVCLGASGAGTSGNAPAAQQKS